MVNIDPEKAVRVVETLGAPTIFCGWLMWRDTLKVNQQTELLQQIALSLARILEHVRQED